jgi:hypothetical protein
VILLVGAGAETGAATVDHRDFVWSNDETVAAGRSIDPVRWREVFEVAMGRIAGRFTRVEPRLRAGRLVLGLLSDLLRKKLLDDRGVGRGGRPARYAASAVPSRLGCRRRP